MVTGRRRRKGSGRALTALGFGVVGRAFLCAAAVAAVLLAALALRERRRAAMQGEETWASDDVVLRALLALRPRDFGRQRESCSCPLRQSRQMLVFQDGVTRSPPDRNAFRNRRRQTRFIARSEDLKVGNVLFFW